MGKTGGGRGDGRGGDVRGIDWRLIEVEDAGNGIQKRYKSLCNWD